MTDTGVSQRLQQLVDCIEGFSPPEPLYFGLLRDTFAKLTEVELEAVRNLVGQDVFRLNEPPRSRGARIELWVHDGSVWKGDALTEWVRRGDEQQRAGIQAYVTGLPG